MPNTAQAKKRLRQDAKRALQNRARRSRYRTEMKKFYAFVAAGEKEQAQRQISVATALLDKAAKTNLLHPNNAARQKSKLSKALASLDVTPTSKKKA